MLYDIYSQESQNPQSAFAPRAVASTSDSSKHNSRKPASAAQTSLFSDAITTSMADDATSRRYVNEVELYLTGSYAARPGTSVLTWWKDHAEQFPILSRIARDILAIPGVSIAVERLFSSCRHTMADERASMNIDSVWKTIIAKEWLKRGMADNLDYLDGIRIHGENN